MGPLVGKILTNVYKERFGVGCGLLDKAKVPSFDGYLAISKNIEINLIFHPLTNSAREYGILRV